MIEDTLKERGKTHGDFKENSYIAQEIKQLIDNSSRGDFMDDVQKEALHMIAHKIARICAGNPHFKDHWVDIQGYAQLVVDGMEDYYPEGVWDGERITMAENGTVE